MPATSASARRSPSTRPATTRPAARAVPRRTSAARRTGSARTRSAASELTEQPAVALDGDGAVGLGTDVLPTLPSHLLEVEPAVVRVPKHPRQRIRTPGRHDDA